MQPWLSKSSASLLSAPSGAAPARPASWGLWPPQLGTHARLKRVPEIWALFLARQTAGPHLLEAFLPLPYCVDARPSPACFGEPGQRSRQADRKSSIGVGALLEIRRAPLAGCPHLHAAGKGYGMRLSGGQRQLLTIARAIMRNADILILDEATNALDTLSEHLIQQSIDELRQNRTFIIFAHRLSTIEHADSIVVLDKGQLVEQGRLHELLALKGYFSALYLAQ